MLGKGDQGMQQTSQILERRNKKRREISPSIFDKNPFTMPSQAGMSPEDLLSSEVQRDL